MIGIKMRKNIPLRSMTQFITYAIIGGTNVLINFIILNILSYMTGITSGFYIFIFDLISFIVYSINGYILNKKFTFRSNNNSYIKYAAVLGISAFFNSILTIALASNNMLSLSDSLWLNVSKFISSILVGIITFLINKFFVFKS